VAVVGHYASSGALRALAHYQAADIVLVSPASTHPDLTRLGKGMVLRLCPVDTAQVGLLATFFSEVTESRTVLAVHDSTSYGLTLATRLVDALPLRGARRLHLDDLTASWEQAHDYDAVFFAGAHVRGASVVRGLRTNDFRGHLVASDDSHIDEFIEMAGEASEGAWVVRSQPSFFETTRMAFELVITALGRAPDAQGAEFVELLRGASPSMVFDERGEHVGASWGLSIVEHGQFRPWTERRVKPETEHPASAP
jgi:ABC-type branched-subunit amino acid transport system substrate-binding protein